MGTYVFSASLTVGAAVHRSTTSIKVQR
jgi:hypothetical protein